MLNNLKQQRGSVMILYVLSFLFMASVFGVLIDTGYVYSVRTKLQNIADAAALAGASQLGLGAGAPEQAVRQYVSENGGSTSTDSLTITYENAVGAETPAAVATHVRVKLLQKMNTFFGRLVGVNTIDVVAAAVAKSGSGSGGGSNFPYHLYAGNELYMGNEKIEDLKGNVYAKKFTVDHNSSLTAAGNITYQELVFNDQEHGIKPNGAQVSEAPSGIGQKIANLEAQYKAQMIASNDAVNGTGKISTLMHDDKTGKDYNFLNDWRIDPSGGNGTPEGVVYPPKNADRIAKPLYFKGDTVIQVSFYPIAGTIIVDGDLTITGNKLMKEPDQMMFNDIYCTGTVTITGTGKEFNGNIVANNIVIKPFSNQGGDNPLYSFTRHTFNAPIVAKNDIRYETYPSWKPNQYDPKDLGQHNYPMAKAGGKLLLVE